MKKKTKFSFITKSPTPTPARSAVTMATMICMALGAAPTAAWADVDARSFVAPQTSQTSSYASQSSSQELETIKVQLQQKTKELEEYKSKLFRASHPEDQSKLMALSRRIAEYENAKQKLNNEISQLQTELALAQKQILTLESSSLALTTLLEGQRTAMESEKQELWSQIHALQDDRSLAHAQEANEKLQNEIASLRLTINGHKDRLSELNRMHDLERESLLKETQSDLALLKLMVDETSKENLRLKMQNESLNGKATAHLATLEKYGVDKQALTVKLLEKEEELRGLQTHYNDTIAEQSKHIEALKGQLAAAMEMKARLQGEKEQLLAQHDVEHHVVSTELSAREIELEKSVVAYQSAVSDYLAEILDLQEKIGSEKENFRRLQESYETLAHELEAQKQSYVVAQMESEDALSGALLGYQMAVGDYLTEIQQTKTLLSIEIDANDLVEHQKQMIVAQHEIEKNVLESMLSEKEEQLSATIANLQMSMGETLEQNQSLQKRLVEAEQARMKLQQAHDDLASQHESLNQALATHDEALNQALAAHDEALKQAHLEKENALNQVLAERENFAQGHSDYQMLIDGLKEHLSKLQAERQQLLDDHAELSALFVNTQQTLSLHEAAKEQYEKMLRDKEEELQHIIHIKATNDNEHYQEQLAMLQQKITSIEIDYTELQNAHDQLNSNANAQMAALEARYKEHLNDDKSTIESLKTEIERLAAINSQQSRKETDLESAIQSLSVVAQRQDQALADANSTFTTVQQYSQTLESENFALKQRLSEYETALREVKKSTDDNSESDHAMLMPAAIMNLIKPNQ